MKTKIALILCIFSYSCLAQEIALTPQNWEGKPVFQESGIMKIDTNSGLVVLKNHVFKDGTIEYDVKPLDVLQLGFSDEIWVFLNGKMVLVDKNHYWEDITMRKYPNGRISIWNSRAPLQLKAGENELLIAVANDFYGWGLMAKFENMEGITDVRQGF